MLTKFQHIQTTFHLDHNISFSFKEVEIKSCLVQLSAPQIQLLFYKYLMKISTFKHHKQLKYPNGRLMPFNAPLPKINFNSQGVSKFSRVPYLF
jgi:hypothetical protein